MEVGARYAAGQACCRVAVILEEVVVLHGAEHEGEAAGQRQTTDSAAHQLRPCEPWCSWQCS